MSNLCFQVKYNLLSDVTVPLVSQARPKLSVTVWQTVLVAQQSFLKMNVLMVTTIVHPSVRMKSKDSLVLAPAIKLMIVLIKTVLLAQARCFWHNFRSRYRESGQKSTDVLQSGRS